MQQHHSAIRRANALVAAALTAFFLAHALLGTLSRLFLDADAPAIVVWAFVLAAAVHMILCLITSKLMLTDTARPPSRKKKNHLWLKWASGVALAACAIFHALKLDAPFEWFIVVVLALLAWHAYIGCKSLARDLDMPRRSKTALRVAIVVVSFCIGLAAAVSLAPAS